MAIRVCVSGITGWTGSSVARAVAAQEDMTLSAGVSRKSAGKSVDDVLEAKLGGFKIQETVEESLSGATSDVLVDFTSAASVKANVLAAINCGVNVIVGSSGLTAEDFAEISACAQKKSVGVIACGNFSITAALAKHFSLLAAQYLPKREIIDYAHAEKLDVPSGTVRELAEQLAFVRANELGRPIDELVGPKETRGAQIGGTPVHSVRLPSYVIGFETIFGLPNERLTLRHDSGESPEPYVSGTLLAIRKVCDIKGLVRGMDVLLFGAD